MASSPQLYSEYKAALQKIADIIKPLPNEISIRGHTDSIPYGPGADYTNWELSTDRANASRRVLLASGMAPPRLFNVVGRADKEHLFPATPNDPRNRRISIILMKQELTDPEFEKKAADKALADNPKLLEETEAEEAPPPEQIPVGTFRKTPGAVEFP